MAQLLYGAPAAKDVAARAQEYTRPLGLRPLLAIVRTGSAEDDVTYEKSIRRACRDCGVDVWTAELPGFVPEDVLVRAVHRLGRDEAVHGVIAMCPGQYDRGLIAAAIGREKDVDGCGFAEGGSFVPCTAEAVMELLDFYGIECAGKKVTVVGRSAVSGAPAAELLASRGAEVTVCHRGTPDPEALCRAADILVSAAGKPGLIDETRMRPGQTIIDVGISVGPDGRVRGDADMEAAGRIAAAVTPVPGGVGAVTPYILALHTARAAAERKKL